MKKSLALIVLTSFLSALLVNVMPVFADDGNLKIYYSEPIGAGEKVYHITACQKVPLYAPVVCTREIKELGSSNGFGQQCDNNDDIGNRIKGCLIPSTQNPRVSVKIDGTSYPDADIAKYSRKKPAGCSDDPDKQIPKYGKMYAFVPARPVAGAAVNDALIRGTAVSHNGNEPAPPTGTTDLAPKQLYQTGLCATWDVLEEGEEDDISANTMAIMNEATAAGANSANLLEAGYEVFRDGCNNSAHTDKLDRAPSASCSYVERISGTSGTSILSNYIGALYKWAAGIIGIIAVLSMVYSGIQISVAGGNVSLVEEARNNIFKSLVGLVILFLSGLILYTINPTFFTGG